MRNRLLRTLAALVACSFLASCATKPAPATAPKPYRISLIVTPQVKPPALYVRDSSNHVVYSWTEHPSRGRVLLAEEREEWAVPVVDGDKLHIQVEGERVSYLHNETALYESAVPYDPAQQYRFELMVYGADGKPAVYRGPLRRP